MTQDQRDILSHIVVDPDAWYQHVLAKFGKERADVMLDEKCQRHATAAQSERSNPGYKNRAEREAEHEAQQQQRRAEQAQRRAEAKAQKDAELVALIDERITLALSQSKL